MLKKTKGPKGSSRGNSHSNAVFISEAVAETDGLSKKQFTTGKADIIRRVRDNMMLDSASEGSSSLKRKSISLNNAGKYKPSYLGNCTSAVHTVDMSTLSRQQKKDFRKKLKFELGQVLSLSSRIEERVFQLKALSGSVGDQACNSAHLSRIDGACSMEKEVTSMPVSNFKKPKSSTREIQGAGPSSMVMSDGNLSTPGSTGKYKCPPKTTKMFEKSDHLTGNEKFVQSERLKGKGNTGPKRLLQDKFRCDFKPLSRQQIRIRRVGDFLKQCGTLLKNLMAHKHAWVFNEPVDAVKLGLPDYHTVIRSPMDLGTIKNKLASGQYVHPHDFAADVRLTFANALKYNPEGHDVHIMAEILRKIFEDKWKVIEEKMGEQTTEAVDIESDVHELPNVKEQFQKLEELAVCLPKPRHRENNLKVREPPKRAMSFDEKRALGEKIKDAPGETMEQIILILKKSNPKLIDDTDIEVDLETTKSETLWELDRYLSDYVKGKGKRNRASYNDQEMLVNNEVSERGSFPGSKGFKGGSTREDMDVDITSIVPVLEKPVAGNTSNLSRSLSSSTDSESSSSDSDSASSSGSESEGEDAQIADDTAIRASPQETEPSRMPLSDPKVSPCSLGVAKENLSIFTGLRGCDISKDLTSAVGVLEEPNPKPARQLSPDKQVRAAMLKGRFADTILKAKEKTLPLSMTDKIDPEKVKREREELERQQKEEKARLQAEAKAAELFRRKAEADAASESRRKREEEREAARMALQQMERTVEFNQEIELSKDLDVLGNAPEQHSSSGGEVSPASSPDGGLPSFGFHPGNPLEQLGLFMKDDYEDEDEKEGDGEVADGEIAYESCDVEEGEIDQ